ncbi:MAG: FliH/SctL family protein [Granulosicoccus sp.]
MSFISLFTDAGSTVATDQVVFSAEDTLALSSLMDQAKRLSSLVAQQERANQVSAKQGFDSGKSDGHGEAQLLARTELAKKLVTVQQDYEHEISITRDASVELALDIVRKIAGQVAPGEWLYAQAIKAAEDLTDQPQLALRVPIQHLEGVKQTAVAAGAGTFVRITGDESLESNECLLDTRFGQVEVDIETQLDEIFHLIQNRADEDV